MHATIHMLRKPLLRLLYNARYRLSKSLKSQTINGANLVYRYPLNSVYNYSPFAIIYGSIRFLERNLGFFVFYSATHSTNRLFLNHCCTEGNSSPRKITFPLPYPLQDTENNKSHPSLEQAISYRVL